MCKIIWYKTQPKKSAFGNSDVLKDISERLDSTLMSLSAFAGLAQENFTHGDGWRFMMLGRRLERVQHTCSILNTMLINNHDDVLLLETLLRLFDSTMTYRSRYRSQIDVRLMLRLLLIDEFNRAHWRFSSRKSSTRLRTFPADNHSHKPIRWVAWPFRG